MRTQCQFTVKWPERRVVLTVAAEPQPCGVQVVEWVGLVGSSFQFFSRLAAVFAEESGGFGVLRHNGQTCGYMIKNYPLKVLDSSL